MLRIAFQMPETGETLWQGGTSVYENYIGALHLTHRADAECWLARRENTPAPPPALVSQSKGVIMYPALRHHSAAWAADYAKHIAFHADLTADRALRARQVNILFGNAPLRRTTLPTLALIPDLQHRHLPDLFAPADRAERDRMFLRTLKRATRVIALSHASCADIADFAPQFRDKLRVAPPEPIIPTEVYLRAPQEIVSKYHLPDKFFYVPNQLWAHKNHQGVLDALKQLKAQGLAVNVVCTGALDDYRNANLVSGLLEKLSLAGLREQFILLGTVPRADVFALHRQAICVLNPSLFEGYGMSIAEARAIGKRVLASDLPAHRELNAPSAEYFDPHNANALAHAMMQIWDTSAPGPAFALEQEARVAQTARVRAVGDALYQAASEIA